jgi:hypothetical protein
MLLYMLSKKQMEHPLKRTGTCVICACGFSLLATSAWADWVSVISSNRSASVLLKIENGSGIPSFGSGTIIDNFGHVLTARHLLGTPDIRRSAAFEISGLVGWKNPSIDFSQAVDLAIDYISAKNDLAVLHFQTSVPDVHATSARSDDVPDGTQIIVMGYPGGGNLTSTLGIASGAAGSGEIKTDARVEKGNSGCGVFDEAGNFVGMLVQGSKNENGDIELGYLLAVTAIVSDMAANHPPYAFGAGPLVAEAPQALERLKLVNISYPLDETKSDHPTLAPSRRTYNRSYQAQVGYKIASANFHASSANHVSSEPQLTVAEDGKSATMRFGLESGPLFDQWRGWLSGVVTLEEAAQ